MCSQRLYLSQLHFLPLASLPGAPWGDNGSWLQGTERVFKSCSGKTPSVINQTLSIGVVCWSRLSHGRKYTPESCSLLEELTQHNGPFLNAGKYSLTVHIKDLIQFKDHFISLSKRKPELDGRGQAPQPLMKSSKKGVLECIQ